MKLQTAILILLILIPISSASVTREFTWNGEKHTTSFSIPYDMADRNITITLTPSPFSDYDIPGYYVTESLPSDITFYGTTAEWSDLTDRTLSILKFMPASDNPSITYTIRLDKEKRYDFFGTYKDENKLTGDIPTQTITVESKPLINFSNIWEPDETEPALPVISVSDNDVSEMTPINASQKSQPDRTTIPLIALLIIVNIGLGYLVYKKYYKKSVPVTQKPEIDELSMIDSIRKKLNIHKPETFEIIGDDDDDDFTDVVRNEHLQNIELLKKIRIQYLERLGKTKEINIRNSLMDKIFDLDKDIEELQSKL